MTLPLSVFNLLGRKIVTLVSEEQQAGQQRVQWNASDFPRGIYYYVIQTSEFSQVKKMILLK